jgi:hypothetical protein
MKPPTDLPSKVTALGAEGLDRREIAVRLGLTLAELEGFAQGDATVARALVLAAEAARVWWEAAPKTAMVAGRRFDLNLWRDQMQTRFGPVETAAGGRPRGGPVYVIPCSGRQRLVGGRCPIASQDTSDWPDAWFANHTPRPCPATRTRAAPRKSAPGAIGALVDDSDDAEPDQAI